MDEGNTQTSTSDSGTINLQAALREATTLQAAIRVICDAIMAKVAKVLAMAVDDVEESRTISSHGTDSLIAVELRNWFARQLEVNVQMLELLSQTTIFELAVDMAAKSNLVNPACRPAVE